MLTSLFFFLFAALLILSALMVIALKNPVHSVLFLILCFFNAAGLFVLLHAEFLAMLLVIVYVGAVAVLFLFVVMMLDIDFAGLRRGFMSYLPAGGAVAAVLLAEILLLVFGTRLSQPVEPSAASIDNTKALGKVLYTEYLFPFQVSGLILLVAMIGAIVLTLRHKPDAKRQDFQAQLARRRDEAVQIIAVKTGSGIES
jgi:NADH-quinone oxidoreductase subunit J